MSFTQVIDFTVNGKCSQCGACCSDILPIRKDEIEKIKEYIKKHKIKEQRHNAMLGADMTCPFRNESHRKCLIYEVRPWICRQFMCNHTMKDIMKAKFDSMENAQVVFMRHTFYGNDEDIEHFQELVRTLNRKPADAV